MGISRITFGALVGLLSLTVSLSQFYNNKPWPTYSLQNMPRTDFNCQDKILGGYYADPETQCQMFHVCVKVAGVGVKDFRFLCPNGTAFDQEAQICADWGDVDCEQATLYYSSDNFDLYRLGSGFESKRAPVVEEETPFHLQHAESSDARRSQQNFANAGRKYNVNSEASSTAAKSQAVTKPSTSFFRSVSTTTTQRPSIYVSNKENDYQSDAKQDDEIFKGSHSSNFFNNRNNGKEDDFEDFTKPPKQQSVRGRQRNPNIYRNNYQGNNNNIPAAPVKQNSPTPAPFDSTINNRQPISNINKKQNFSKTLTLKSTFLTAGINVYNTNEFSSTTEAAFSTTSKPVIPQNNRQINQNTRQNIQPTTYNPSSTFNVKPTTPVYNDFRSYSGFEKSSSPTSSYTQSTQNAFYNVQFENKATEKSFEGLRSLTVAENQSRRQNNKETNVDNKEINSNFGRNPARNNKRVFSQDQDGYFETSRQNFEAQPVNALGDKDGQRSATPQRNQPNRKNQFRGNKNFNRGVPDQGENKQLNVRPLEPQRIQTTSTTPAAPQPFSNPFPNQRPPYEKINRNQNTNAAPQFPPFNPNQNLTVQRNFNQSPAPFSLQSNTEVTKPNITQDYYVQPNQYSAVPAFSNNSPRGFSHPQQTTQFAASTTFSTTTRPYTPEKYQKSETIRDNNFTPPTTPKKFSTLVPKDQYHPTTFKPTTYKKYIDGYEQTSSYTQSTIKFSAASYLPTTSTTPVTPSEAGDDGDDGQYRPELYEKDFARNKLRNKQSRTKVTRPAFNNDYQSFATSDEDEFLKTAHSLNIAAGANQLRAEKAKQASKATTYKTVQTTPLPKTSKKPAGKKPTQNEDASYDYAYYDSFSGSPHDYAEYDVISEFGKTRKQ